MSSLNIDNPIRPIQLNPDGFVTDCHDIPEDFGSKIQKSP